MNIKISLGAAIAFALVVAAAVFSITMDYAETKTNENLSALHEREAFYEKFSEVERKVRDSYYGEINEAAVLDATARGFLQGVDSSSVYYTAEEYLEMVEDETEDIATVGITAKRGAEGYLEITDVVVDSPAYISGIRENDLIIEMDGQTVSSENNSQLISGLDGPEGTKLTLTTRTQGEDRYHDLTRRIIETPTVSWRMEPETTTAYIRISAFDKNTGNQFTRALTTVQDEGATGLVLDLRGNTSTSFSSGIRVLNRIVPSGPLLNTVDKGGNIQELAYSDNMELTLPIAVIVNGETSGAAEMFAQVLVDYDKANTVGTTTAGHGVQTEIIRLSDGSAIELTVALYQSPVTQTTFHGEGLHPDYDVSIAGLDQESDWVKLAAEQDTQLQRALEVVSTA